MKKITLTLSMLALLTISKAQTIQIKLDSVQSVQLVAAVTCRTDTITVISIIDNGSSVTVNLYTGEGYIQNLILWSGASYISNENWSNSMIIARIEQLLNIH